MHLVCLGVVKRLLKLWVAGKNVDIGHKLSDEDIDRINKRIIDCSKHFPSEFNRKGRDIREFSRWKAVECRSFLLYSGIVVLKDILSEKKYKHFLLLHVAMRVLLSPTSTIEEIRYAGRCLTNFVNLFETIYGMHHLVYNVHNLIHLSDDCIHFKGPLDEFSCFPFENFLGQMKNLLRGTRKVLAQLIKRLVEIGKHDSLKWLKNKVSRSKRFNCNLNQDIYYVLGNGVFVKLVRILDNDPVLARRLQMFVGSLDFYEEPLKSSLIGIQRSTGLEGTISSYPIDLLTAGSKCIFLPATDDHSDDSDPDNVEVEFILIPLLHQKL